METETALDVMKEIRDELNQKGVFAVPAIRVEERIRTLETQAELALPGSVEEYGLRRAIAELRKLVSKMSVSH